MGHGFWDGRGWIGLLAAATLGLAGCSGGHSGHGEGHGGGHIDAHDEHAHHDMAGLEATAGPGFTVDDAMFMQMMMGHHAQAVTMASLVPDRSADEAVGRLALKIRIAQDDEIALMRRWLEERGQAVPTAEQMGAMQMPGMIARAQLEQLEGLQGRAFDVLFLELMIEHHLGALSMVDALFAAPGSLQDSELFQFVSDVGTEQLDEIGVMESLLERLATQARSAVP